jgi:hypothetical protein
VSGGELPGDRGWRWRRALLRLAVLAVALVAGFVVYVAIEMGAFSRDQRGSDFLAAEPMVSVEVPGAAADLTLNQGGKDWKGWRAATFTGRYVLESEALRDQAFDLLVEAAGRAGWEQVAAGPETGGPDGPKWIGRVTFTKPMTARVQPADLEISRSASMRHTITLEIRT